MTSFECNLLAASHFESKTQEWEVELKVAQVLTMGRSFPIPACSADYAKPGVMLSSACPVEGLAQQGFEIRLTLWSVSFA